MARDEDHLVRLTSVRTELEGGVIVGGLEASGIESAMSGVYTTNFRADAPGWVEVLVAKNDLEHAETVLDEVRREGTVIDWSQVDVGEPGETIVSETRSWWTYWRRFCQGLILIYLIYLLYVAVQFVAGFFLTVWHSWW